MTSWWLNQSMNIFNLYLFPHFIDGFFSISFGSRQAHPKCMFPQCSLLGSPVLWKHTLWVWVSRVSLCLVQWVTSNCISPKWLLLYTNHHQAIFAETALAPQTRLNPQKSTPVISPSMLLFPPVQTKNLYFILDSWFSSFLSLCHHQVRSTWPS